MYYMYTERDNDGCLNNMTLAKAIPKTMKCYYGRSLNVLGPFY